jgi:uncharacterized protein YecT (DUF1311 family)
MRAIAPGIVAALIFCGAAYGQQQPSFNCATAKTASARLICSDPELSNADGALGKAFQGAVRSLEGKQKAAKIQEQVKWIRERNTRCQLDGKPDVPIEELSSSKPCMLEAINARVNEYLGASPPTQTAAAEKPPLADATPTIDEQSDFNRWTKTMKIGVRCDGFSPGDGFDFAPVNGPTIRFSGRIDPSINIREFASTTKVDHYLSFLYDDAKKYCDGQVQSGKVKGPLLQSMTIALDYDQYVDNNARGGASFAVFTQDGKHFAQVVRPNGATFSEVAAFALKQDAEQANVRRAQQEAAAEQQRQQRMFEEARRQQAEQQRQAEIAQAKIDAQSGDPLVGNWKSQYVTLRITKNGNLYLVHADNPNGMVKGDFAGPYRDDQILIGSPFGNIAVLQSKTQVLFAGEMFTKAGQ